jgi:hypothetical protein
MLPGFILEEDLVGASLVPTLVISGFSKLCPLSVTYLWSKLKKE